MAKSTDKDIPRPATTSLRATPGSFHLIQAHPAISNQHVAGASSNTPPLHPAIRPVLSSAPLSQRRPTSPSHNPPSSSPSSARPEPRTPTDTSTLHRAIKHTPYASRPPYLSQQPPSRFPVQSGFLNTLPLVTSPSLQPPLWHTHLSSQYRNALPGPLNTRPLEVTQSASLGQRRVEFEASSSLKKTQARQVAEAINSQYWIESEDSVAIERSQTLAPTEANNEQPCVVSEASIALERSQTQALAEAINGQSTVEAEAFNRQQRNPSRVIAEIDKLMEDDG